MDLLCGVPKPAKAPSWGSWGRKPRLSSCRSYSSRGEQGIGMRRAATMPTRGVALNKTDDKKESSPLPCQRHLLPSLSRQNSTSPSNPYVTPFCLDEVRDPLQATTQDSLSQTNNRLDEEQEDSLGTLRRSKTLPLTDIRRSGISCDFKSSVKRPDSQTSVNTDDSNAANIPIIKVRPTSPSEASLKLLSDSEQSEVTKEDNNDDTYGTLRRTLTLPQSSICKHCPERRKQTLVYSRTSSSLASDNISPTSLDSAGSIIDEHDAVLLHPGKRHSLASTTSGLSRFTSTTSTDEGISLYSDGSSAWSSAASTCSSIRHAWGATSITSADEGVSEYSAPSVAASSDISSLSNGGARPKVRIPSTYRNINRIIKTNGLKTDSDNEELCLRCQREASSSVSNTFRRTKSLRAPRQLPVTPTLLKLLRLVSIYLYFSVLDKSSFLSSSSI